MKPRINIITLDTRDLEKFTKFYQEGLGLPKMDSPGNISFFTLNGSWLALFPWELLCFCFIEKLTVLQLPTELI